MNSVTDITMDYKEMKMDRKYLNHSNVIFLTLTIYELCCSRTVSSNSAFKTDFSYPSKFLRIFLVCAS